MRWEAFSVGAAGVCPFRCDGSEERHVGEDGRVDVRLVGGWRWEIRPLIQAAAGSGPVDPRRRTSLASWLPWRKCEGCGHLTATRCECDFIIGRETMLHSALYGYFMLPDQRGCSVVGAPAIASEEGAHEATSHTG